MTMLRQSFAGLRLLLVLTVVLGIGYPLLISAVGLVLPHQAGGSPAVVDGRTVGSTLIGQAFDGPEWFHPRPSAAGDGYNAMSSSGSNLGPSNPDLVATIEERRAAVAALEGVEPTAVPADAVTASGSGLDPHISPEYAELQMARVARERGLDPAEVSGLVARHTARPDLGFLGRPRVNVLELNIAIDELTGE